MKERKKEGKESEEEMEEEEDEEEKEAEEEEKDEKGKEEYVTLFCSLLFHIHNRLFKYRCRSVCDVFK